MGHEDGHLGRRRRGSRAGCRHETRTAAPGPPPQGLPPAAWLTGVQARLKYLGYYAGPIQDRFDTPTRNPVLAFQGGHGLKADGIPGPKTQTNLVEFVGA